MGPDRDSGASRDLFDTNDPEDLRVLISSGVIWRGGPKTIAKAVRALLDGTVERPDNLPQKVIDLLSQLERNRSTAEHGDARTDEPDEPAPHADRGPWVCPQHESEAIVELKARGGEVIRACDMCDQIEG